MSSGPYECPAWSGSSKYSVIKSGRSLAGKSIQDRTVSTLFKNGTLLQGEIRTLVFLSGALREIFDYIVKPEHI